MAAEDDGEVDLDVENVDETDRLSTGGVFAETMLTSSDVGLSNQWLLYGDQPLFASDTSWPSYGGEDMDDDSRATIERMLKEEQQYMNQKGSRNTTKNKLKTSTKLDASNKAHIVKGVWNEEEITGFHEGMKLFGQVWSKIAEHIGTRTTLQVRNYARAYWKKMAAKDQTDQHVTSGDPNVTSSDTDPAQSPVSTVHSHVPDNFETGSSTCHVPLRPSDSSLRGMSSKGPSFRGSSSRNRGRSARGASSRGRPKQRTKNIVMSSPSGSSCQCPPKRSKLASSPVKKNLKSKHVGSDSTDQDETMNIIEKKSESNRVYIEEREKVHLKDASDSDEDVDIDVEDDSAGEEDAVMPTVAMVADIHQNADEVIKEVIKDDVTDIHKSGSEIRPVNIAEQTVSHKNIVRDGEVNDTLYQNAEFVENVPVVRCNIQLMEQTDEVVMEQQCLLLEQPDKFIAQPDQSVEQTDQSIEYPVQLMEQPAQFLEHPAQLIEQPTQSAEPLVQSLEQPKYSTEQTILSMEQPTLSVEQHVQSVEQADHPEQPAQSGEQSNHMLEQIPTIGLNNNNQENMDVEIQYKSTHSQVTHRQEINTPITEMNSSMTDGESTGTDESGSGYRDEGASSDEEEFIPKATKEMILDNDVITDEEKLSNPCYFQAAGATKTPRKYLLIRNRILECWYKCRPAYLTKTAVRPCLKGYGDVNRIGSIHTALEIMGAINFGVENPFHSAVLARKKSKITRSSSLSAPNLRPRPKRSCNSSEAKAASTVETNPVTRGAADKSIRKRRVAYDPFKLIQCAEFSDSKMAPFNVVINTSALILMDLHAHLSTTEIIGLLGGDYDESSGMLEINEAKPCQSLSTGMQCEMDPVSQTEASEAIMATGSRVVGWYHSHPTFDPNPSVRDIETQADFQAWFGPHVPFVGVIVSPSLRGIQARRKQSVFKCLTISQEYLPGSTTTRQPYNFIYTVKSDINEDTQNGLLQIMSDLITQYSTSQHRTELLQWKWPHNLDKLYMEKVLSSLKSHLSTTLKAATDKNIESSKSQVSTTLKTASDEKGNPSDVAHSKHCNNILESLRSHIISTFTKQEQSGHDSTSAVPIIADCDHDQLSNDVSWDDHSSNCKADEEKTPL